MDNKDQVLVGIIGSAHGVDGRVKVLCLSDNPQRFAASAVLTTNKGRQLTIESVSAHKGMLLVKFAGVDDRTAAEKLRDSELVADPQSAPPLPEGEYYHFQLEGLEVIENGVKLGRLKEILSYSANDIYVVSREEGNDLLIPALKSIVKSIDLTNGTITVELPEGLK